MTWKPEILDFEPVKLRFRSGGWTVWRQRGFIEVLAETANVRAAARSVGLTAKAAYLLRARADATSFREAWDAVVAVVNVDAHNEGMSRVMNGRIEPVFYHGVQVGTRRHDDNGLLIKLMDRGDRLLTRCDRSSHNF